MVPNEVAQAKRSKTSASWSYSAGGSDARYAIDIKDEPEFEDEAPTPESIWPPGRDRAKKDRAKASGSKTTSSGDVSKLDTILQKIDHFMGVQEERYKKKEQEKEVDVGLSRERLEFDKRRIEFDLQNQETEEFRIMTTDIESLLERDRAVLSKMKDKIAKKWLGGSGSGL
ncbi:putative egg-laying hormone/atrial gland peptide [Helianthus annuus]|nr:putative egg-laying hormone/atrial gland peptide [Helianthus annuus]